MPDRCCSRRWYRTGMDDAAVLAIGFNECINARDLTWWLPVVPSWESRQPLR